LLWARNKASKRVDKERKTIIKEKKERKIVKNIAAECFVDVFMLFIPTDDVFNVLEDVSMFYGK
jgi:hypothetical protein